MESESSTELAAEITHLKRAIRELVLPGLTSADDPTRVAEGQVIALCRSLPLEFAFLALRQGTTVTEFLRCKDGVDSPERSAAIRAALAPVLADAAASSPEIDDPLGAEKLRLGVTRFGNAEEGGVLVAAGRSAKFPSEDERLLLDVAANQVMIASRGQRANHARAALAAIVESSDDAVVGKTLQGIITSWNAGAQRVFGWTEQEVLGHSIERLIPPEHLEEEQEILARLRSGERVEHYETVRVRKDGRRIDISLTVSPVRDDSGRVVGASKIARDITARKLAEREAKELLAREREALRESQLLNDLARKLGAELDVDRLVQEITDTATLLTGAQFGAFFHNVTDDNGESYTLYTLSGAPKAAFERFGLPRNTPLFAATFAGGPPVRIDDVPSDPRYGQNPPRHGMPEGHLPVRSYLAVSVVSRSGDVLGGLFFGHPVPGVFTERAERLVQGIAAQAGICMDNAQLYRSAQREIVERRAAEDRERAARTDAERATRTRDDFLATVSHELRTPLNSILGWSQLLQRAPNDPDIRGQALDAIERGTRAQARLVDDLLDVSRIISGKLRLDVQPVELVTIVHAAIETVRPAAEAKNIRVDRVLDPRAGPIKGDPARLQQIVWNLLSNAVKFTPRDGKAQVHVERVDSHVEITVSDNGCGIPADLLPHVFDRFWQADASTTRSSGGLGLGLALVKHLTELHGGKVYAHSPGEGKGSTFTVHLPTAVVQQEPEGRQHPITPRGPAEIDEAELTDVKVLVVDDDRDAVEILKRVLRERGADVDTALSAREALRRFASFSPQVILSDIGMPEMDGYEFIREVRRRGSKVPAVAVTAFGRSEDRVRSLRAGYQMHLAKPLEPRELVEVVATLVRNEPPAAR